MKDTNSENRHSRLSWRSGLGDDKAKAKSIKIVAIYLTFGCIWILGTDLLSNTIFNNIPDVYAAGIIKGLFFVFVTALIIYLLIYPPLRNLTDSEKKLQGINEALAESNQKYIRLVEELEEKQAQLNSMSRRDALTGLHNRVYYEQERDQIDSTDHLPLSVIVCDVDGLKLVNDAFGHVAGDNLLIAASEILKNACREQDIAIRTGGDEFSVFFPGTSNAQIEKIFNLMNDQSKNKKIQAVDGLQFTSISMGYATKENESQTLEEVILAAEEFMYRRKLLARKGSHSVLMKSIMTTLHEKSFETQEHCSRMSDLARRLGQALRVSLLDLDILELAASLHDVGKISIDLSILQKKEPLTKQDWDSLKKHPEVGWRITQSIPELNPISEIVLHHHERWDGTGYPRGLAGVEIPLLARIIAIVDAYDAMIEERPYRNALSKEEAAHEILRMAGTQFDKDIADIFVNQVIADELH